MRQIPPINRHFTESPKPFFVFMAGNNHHPSTSFPYRFLYDLLQKFVPAHNKYGVIMPRLVQTLRDCRSTFKSVDPNPGVLSGALDFGRRARICKWVALGLKFISSPIKNAVKPLRIQRELSFLIDLWVYGRPLGWRPRRSREGRHLTPLKLTPLLAILWVLSWAQLHAFPGTLGIKTWSKLLNPSLYFSLRDLKILGTFIGRQYFWNCQYPVY